MESDLSRKISHPVYIGGIWIPPLGFLAEFRNAVVIALLRSHLKKGGSYLLSLRAAQYVVDLGLGETPRHIIEVQGWSARAQPGARVPPIFAVGIFSGDIQYSPAFHQAASTVNCPRAIRHAHCFY